MIELYWILYSTGFLAVAVLFLWIAKKLFDLSTPYSVNVQLTEKDNPAVGIVMSGYLLGVIAVLCGVFMGETAAYPTLELFLEEIAQTAIYGVLGILLLLLAGVLNDRVVLHKFSNTGEIIKRKNSAVAVVMSVSYIGSGLVIAGGIRGSIDFISALVAFGMGQALLIVFALIYQAATRYDDLKEIGENMNVAAGLAFAGNILAYSMILMKGVTVNPSAAEQWMWMDRLLNLGYYALAGAVLLIITRIVNDHLFLPGVRISTEIIQDRNLNAGFMEAALALSMGAVLIFCL